MSESMVERVARALLQVDPEGDPRTRLEWYVPQARAAIAAMREPTVDMIELGYSYKDRSPIETWHAMIDAALQEDKG